MGAGRFAGPVFMPTTNSINPDHPLSIYEFEHTIPLVAPGVRAVGKRRVVV
jgi:hypothetical protein